MILRSLRLIGEKSRGATLTSAEQVECPAEMNAMLESWSLQRGMIQSEFVTSFALTVSTFQYTIGPGAAFNMDRPIKIIDPCFLRTTSNDDYELEIIDNQAYGRIVDKLANGTFPTYLNYDESYSATSTAVIRLWPGPVAGLTLFLNTLQPFTNVSTASQQLSLPPGYELAVVANYAIHAAGGFANVQPEVAKMAKDSLAAIKSNNLPSPVMRLDYGVAGMRGSNILTGP